MKTIIAGSRTIEDYGLVVEALSRINWDISEVVSGAARGIDALGERWAKENNIPIKYFPAEWSVYGKAAGPIRNAQMAKYADALVALWDGESRGTSNMISEAKELGLHVVIFLEDELKNKKQSNPIKSNPIFGDQILEKEESAGVHVSRLPTKTISLNDKKLVIYEDSSKNQPMVNMVAELVEEIKKLKGI